MPNRGRFLAQESHQKKVLLVALILFIIAIPSALYVREHAQRLKHERTEVKLVTTVKDLKQSNLQKEKEKQDLSTKVQDLQKLDQQRLQEIKRLEARASRGTRTRTTPQTHHTFTLDPSLRGKILLCIRSYETSWYDGYDTDSTYDGAYQFAQSTFNGAVARAGHPEWVGISASLAPPEIQDDAAWQLVQESGLSQWPTPNRKCVGPDYKPKGM